MPPQAGGARGSERGTGRGPGAVGKVQAGGAGVTHKPQAHPPQGAGWPWRPQGDRAGRQCPQGPAASRGEPRLDAHRKLATPLPAKLESLHFSEEQIEASESGECIAGRSWHPGLRGPSRRRPVHLGASGQLLFPVFQVGKPRPRVTSGQHSSPLRRGAPSSAGTGSSGLGAHLGGNLIGGASPLGNRALFNQKSQPLAGLVRNLSFL